MRYWHKNRKGGGRPESVSPRLKKFFGRGMRKEAGIDGILVTVGLCIIALLLCVVMKKSMTGFIETIVTALTTEAQKILTGVAGTVIL